MKEEEHGEEEELTEVMASAAVQYQVHSEEEDFTEPKRYTVGKKRSGGVEKDVGASWAMAPV
jgi:hypothetical protein